MPKYPTPLDLTSLLTRKSLAAVVFLATAASLHGTLFWIGHAPSPRPLVGDEPMYWDGAATLAAGETWLYESLWPPLQPVVLSVILAASGGSMLAVEIVQTLMLLAVALLLADLTRQLSGSHVASAVAGGLVLIDPQLAGFAHFLWPEVLHLLLFTATVWILVRKAESSIWVFAAGASLGLALCSKYLVWPFLFLALPAMALIPSLRPAMDRMALFVAGLVLIAGLVLSSERLQVKGYPIVESATFNVWVGLNDRSRKDFVEPVVGERFRRYASMSTVRGRNELMWGEISALARERGIFHLLASQIGRQYFRLFDKDTFLTDQLPGGALADDRRGYRATPAAVALAIRTWSYSIHGVVLAGAIGGIVVFPTRGRRWSRYFLLFLAYTMLVFLVAHVKSRFRIQMLPFLFMYSGCAAAWLFSKLGWNVEETEIWKVEPERRSWLAAAGGAALLLFLAFGRSLL